jgi:hypothetical protein
MRWTKPDASGDVTYIKRRVDRFGFGITRTRNQINDDRLRIGNATWEMSDLNTSIELENLQAEENKWTGRLFIIITSL